MFQRKNATFLVLLVTLFIQTMYCLDLMSNDQSLNEAGLAILDYIQPCSRSDPNLGSCLAKVFNQLILKGIPKYQLPGIDPLTIPNCNVNIPIGLADFDVKLSNIVCTGVKNYNVTSIQMDLNKGKLNIFLTIPRIRVRGSYNSHGRIILVSIDSQGEFLCRFVGISVGVQAILKIEIRKGVRYVRVTELEYYFDLDDAKAEVTDDVVNLMLNGFSDDNVHNIINGVKPTSSSPIHNDRYIMSVINDVLMNIPLKVWLPDA